MGVECCEFLGCPGDLDEDIEEYEEPITIGLDEYLKLHPSCREELEDVYSREGPEPMHPNETSEEFWEHE